LFPQTAAGKRRIAVQNDSGPAAEHTPGYRLCSGARAP
jgi:hypothetical protein